MAEIEIGEEPKTNLTEFQKAVADIADYARRHPNVTPQEFADHHAELILEKASHEIVRRIIRANNLCGFNVTNVDQLVNELKCDCLELRAELSKYKDFYK